MFPPPRDGLEAAARNQGWSTERIRDEATFCRLIIHGNDNLLIELALDSPPGQPATASLIGPTFAREELAGRKVLALFDRAEARDFADVFELSEHFSKSDLLHQAARVDPGFEERIFAQMLTSLARFSDQDLRPPSCTATRTRWTKRPSWGGPLVGSWPPLVPRASPDRGATMRPAPGTWSTSLSWPPRRRKR